MAALVRAVLPVSQSIPAAAFDDADDSFEDSVEELESFASATSFVFQPGSAEIVIGAAEAAVLLQAGSHSNHKCALIYLVPTSCSFSSTFDYI